MKILSTPFKYNDGGRKEAGFKGDAGDCVCRAITIASGKSYKEVYNRLAEGNANQRLSKYQSVKKSKSASSGVSVKRKWFADYVKELGFEWIPTMFIGSGCKVHLCAEELPKGKLIVSVSKHLTCVIDGVINDTFNPARGATRCVYGYWILK